MELKDDFLVIGAMFVVTTTRSYKEVDIYSLADDGLIRNNILVASCVILADEMTTPLSLG